MLDERIQMKWEFKSGWRVSVAAEAIPAEWNFSPMRVDELLHLGFGADRKS